MRKIMAVILTVCMLLSCGIANAAFTALQADENIVRIGVFADSHVLDDSSAINDVISAFETLDANLDGIVMGGDIVANAPTELLSNLYDVAVADTKLSAWLNKKPAVETATRTINEAEYSVGTNSGDAGLVWVMGNHEFNTNNSDIAQPEAWKLFQEKTGFGIRGNVKMGGYHFIYSAAQGYVGTYTEEDQKWMIDELKAVLSDESYAGKPVFLALHHPIPQSYHDTTNGVNGSNFIAGRYTDEFINYVKSQPRIIEFSAHTHYPIQDPRMIRQPENGGFTAVQIPFAGNGTFTLDRSADVRTASQEDSYGQALMLEINKTTNVVTIKRLNIATGEFIGNDWTVDVANEYNYTDARYENGEAPVFSSGSVTASDITGSTATVTFPAATKFSAANETSYANIYDVKIVKKSTNVVEFSKSMVSDYYKLTQADTFSMNVDNLDANTEYVAYVTAISPYGKEATISGEFTTNGEESNPVTIEDGKEILAGTEVEGVTISSGTSAVNTATAGVMRWVKWIEQSSNYVEWTFTPSYTANYTLASTVSFGDGALSVEPTVSMSVNGEQVGESKTIVRQGANTPVDVAFGEVCLEKGVEYTIRTTLYASLGSGSVSSIWGASVNYSSAATEEQLKELIAITFTSDDEYTGDGTLNAANKYINWWNGDGSGCYIEWDVTPSVTGVYEIVAKTGYTTYDYTVTPTLKASVDGNEIGVAEPTIFEGTQAYNDLTVGEVLLEEGKTYKLRLKNGGSGYAVYFKSATIAYKRAADASEFWKDSVTVNGWEPTVKYVAGITENYGVIIAQSNHYATYTVAPGAGFFKLSITYGAGSSLDADAPLTLNVNGKSLGTIIAPDNDCYWPNESKAECTLDLGVIKLKEGDNTITLGHTGASGAAYYSVGKVMVNAIATPAASIYSGKYVDENKVISNVQNGTMTAYARLPRSLDGKSLFVAFAIYEDTADGSTKLVDVAIDRFVADEAGEATLTIDAIAKNNTSNYRYRLFYIESDENFKPLF